MSLRESPARPRNCSESGGGGDPPNEPSNGAGRSILAAPTPDSRPCPTHLRPVATERVRDRHAHPRQMLPPRGRTYAHPPSPADNLRRRQSRSVAAGRKIPNDRCIHGCTQLLPRKPPARYSYGRSKVRTVATERPTETDVVSGHLSMAPKSCTPFLRKRPKQAVVLIGSSV